MLKLYAWEDSFEDHVTDIREKELKILRNMALLSAGGTISWFMSSYIVGYEYIYLKLKNTAFVSATNLNRD